MAGITFRNIKGTALTFSELDANLGEYFVSASISGSNLELFKSGSGGTVVSSSIAIPDNSSTIDTGSFAVTGSNVFLGNQVITGSVDVTGSVTFANDINVNSLTIGRGSGNSLQNTALGDQTLLSNTTGNNNVAVGKNSLTSNTDGDLNTAVGHTSLDSNTTGDFNTGVGASALGANIDGRGNTGIGYASLTGNISGDFNTATGYLALQFNTTGYSNTAYGQQALRQNSTGFFNTAVGSVSLRNNTSGSINVAIGYNTLEANTLGSQNTAIGVTALKLNTTGDDNTAIGTGGLYNNISGSNNIAVGIEALYNNVDGGNNVGVGRRSLYTLETGSNNTAVGDWAGQYSGAGLIANSSSNTSTFIGANTRAGADGQSNQTVIGYNAIGNGSNTVTIGNSSISSAHIQVDWTITSDERDKVEISPIPHGLDFVHQLSPIQYQFKDGDRESTEGDGNVRYGFSAQEILALEGENPVIVNNKDPEKLKLTQAYIIPTLVKAIKELSEKVTTLESRLNSGG